MMSTKGGKVAKCKHGYFLFNPDDQYIGAALDHYAEYDEEALKIFKIFVKPGSTVIDAGANIGALTIPLANLTTATGMVIAFEPQRLIFNYLCANIALNNLKHVHPFRAGLGTERGTAYLPEVDYDAPNNFGGISLYPKPSGGEEVTIATLDGLDLPACDFIKIDVEGMEQAVLLGGQGLIDKHRPVLYVENDREEHKDNLIGMLSAFGYDLYWHSPLLFNKNNYNFNLNNIFPNIASRDMLCVPTERKMPVRGLERANQ